MSKIKTLNKETISTVLLHDFNLSNVEIDEIVESIWKSDKRLEEIQRTENKLLNFPNDHEHFKSLLLYPDHSASGLWCSCGVSLGNILDVLPISHYTVNLLELWGTAWELATNQTDVINVEEVESLIIETGRHLADVVAISSGVPCILVEENCEIEGI